jgi:predicted SnoaL-like aldol condensation-catalyzing enzyme
VSHFVALPFTLISILRQKEALWKLKYFTMHFKKNPLKETKILQAIRNSIIITNLKFQHKPKYHHLSKMLKEK